MKKIFGLVFLYLMMLFSSCGEKVYDLNEMNAKLIKYTDLPDTVKYIVEMNDCNREIAKHDFYATNLTINFSYGHGGRSGQWISEANYHHFFIDWSHYRFLGNGNYGKPFILHEGFIYFPVDLNGGKNNYYKLEIPGMN